jgi:hypothetical protein
VKSGGYHAFQQGQFIGVMVVEGGAVKAGGIGDFVDGDFVEIPFILQ